MEKSYINPQLWPALYETITHFLPAKILKIPPYPTITPYIFYEIHPIHRKSLKTIKTFS